jgi:hypothetical protein
MDTWRALRVGIMLVSFVVALACSLPSAVTPEPAPPVVQLGTPRPKATVAPVATPPPVAEAPTATPPVVAGPCSRPQAVYGDVGFCYDPAVASDVEFLLLPAAQEEVLFTETWSLPERLQFGLIGYPKRVDRQGMPHLIVYPTEMLRNAHPTAAGFVQEVERLLSVRPSSGAIDEIPVILPVNAAQVFRARVSYLSEGNARGVSFLTTYAQDVTPIVNESLFYIYEGFIGDGRQMVVAWLPVYHPSLRDSWAEYSDAEMDMFYDDYMGYLDAVTADLEMEPADSFVPSLELLDAMMLSVQVR